MLGDVVESTFQDRMKKRLRGAYRRLLDKGGQSPTSPYTVKRPSTSNAFLAKEEVEDIEEMSAMGGAGGAGGSVEGGARPKREDKPIYKVYDKPGVKAMSYEDFAEEVKSKKLRNAIRENL